MVPIFKTMEKYEFCLLIKHCVLVGKIQFKQSYFLISVTRILLRRRQWLRGALLTLNVVVQTQMMLNVQATQIRQLSRKTPKNPQTRFANRKMKLREIADDLKISEDSVFTILHEFLSMRMLCSKWVPRLLTVDQKQQHVDNSKRCSQLSTQ